MTIRLTSVVAGILEISVLAFTSWNLIRARKKYHESKNSGDIDSGFIVRILQASIPNPIVRLVALELRIYGVYYQYLFKRKPPQQDQFLTKLGTHKFFLGAMLFITMLEISVVELAIPHRYLKLRLLLLILAVWAVIYIFGLYLGVARYGHRIVKDGIYLQVGFGLSGFIPYEKIDSIVGQKKQLPAYKMKPFSRKDEPGVIYATAGDECNVTIVLKDEIVLDGMLKKFKPCKIIHLSLERRDEFVNLIPSNVPAKITMGDVAF